MSLRWVQDISPLAMGFDRFVMPLNHHHLSGVDAAGFEPANSEIDSTATLNPNFKRVVLTSFAVNRASTSSATHR